MNDKYRGQITIMADNYNSNAEYEQAVLRQIMLLIGNRYQLKIYTELGEKAQVIIEYGYDNPDFRDNLVWLDDEELESLICKRLSLEKNKEGEE